MPSRDFNPEASVRIDDNPFRRVSHDPLSTFSIDVDTASYANVRRFLNDGSLPPRDAVRIEELVNYFRFEYPRPVSGQPFSVSTEIAACPWNPKHKLALIGLQARPLDMDSVPARNLVFLIDVSGSMMPADEAAAHPYAMRMLVDTLTERPHRDRRLCRFERPRAAVHERRAQEESAGHRATRSGRLDERRRRHRMAYQVAGTVRQGRHQRVSSRPTATSMSA
jgi:hypothetical protein